MKIYLIRHGQSNTAASGKHQDDFAELSEHGILQAEFLAKRFVEIPIDVVISSPFTWTKQTAEIVNQL